jgi:L-alanine-DL-glutamate epimerase-like enolase superfamily enzyme
VRDRTVESVDVAVYRMPTDVPEADGTATWSSTTMVLSTVRCGGTVGFGWTYGPAACAAVVRDELADRVVGTDPMRSHGTWLTMVETSRNHTPAGVVGYAISSVDTALWDLKARLLGVPLAELFGKVRDDVEVYGSGGFTTYDDRRTAAQLGHWVHEQQVPRVKIKIGESFGTAEDRDVHRIELAREVIGADAELFVDANGGYTAKQAVRVMHRVAEADVRWLEEPVSSQDLEGLCAVRGLVDADVAAGEYGTDVVYFGRMCAARAVDCLQVDATRAGGYTAWFQAASVAAAHGLEVSAHCAPNLHAPAAAATMNLRHVEWFHDHVRMESAFFDGALDPQGGVVTPDPERVGNGLAPREDAMEPFRIG